MIKMFGSEDKLIEAVTMAAREVNRKFGGEKTILASESPEERARRDFDEVRRTFGDRLTSTNASELARLRSRSSIYAAGLSLAERIDFQVEWMNAYYEWVGRRR